ncbi:TDRD12 family protein [Megaselia abdita]
MNSSTRSRIVETLDKEEIVISHFINPNSFYFRYSENDEELDLLDNVVAEAAKVAKQDKRYIIGQKVIVEFLPQKKFLRGVIDDIKTNYIIWAIDYGFPIATPVKFVYRMNRELEEFDGGYVQFGGISNVIPAKEIYDYSKGKANIIGEKSWNEIAMDVILNYIKNSHKIWMIKERVLPIPGERFQILGDLELIQSSNNTITFKKYLLEKMFALEIPTEQFEIALKRIRTNAIVRWKNFALVECCQRNELLKKKSIEVTDKSPRPVSVEYDDDDESIELNEKISDWNFRNELESRKEKRVTIVAESPPDDDEIAFDDSVSCAQVPGLNSSSWIKKTRSISDVRKKYGDLLPPPPPSSDNDVTDEIPPNLRPPKVEKQPSEVSMRARHLEIFKKLQEKQKREELLEANQEKYYQENAGAHSVDNLWSTGNDNSTKQLKTKVSLPAGFDLANLKIGSKQPNANFYQGSNSSGNNDKSKPKNLSKNQVNLDFHSGRKNENDCHPKPSSSSQKKSYERGDEAQSEISESSSTKLSTAQKIALKARNARINASFVSTSSSENLLMKSLDRKEKDQISSDDQQSVTSSYLNRIADATKSNTSKKEAKKSESVESKPTISLAEKPKSSIQKIMEMKAAMLHASSKTASAQSSTFDPEIPKKEGCESFVSEGQKKKPTNLEKIMQLKDDMLLSKKSVEKSNSSLGSKIESIKELRRESTEKVKPSNVEIPKSHHSHISQLESIRDAILSKPMKTSLPRSSSSQISKIESIRESFKSKNENANSLEKLTETQRIAEQLKQALQKNNLDEFFKANTTNLIKQNTFQRFQEQEVSLPIDHNLVMVHGRYIIPPVTNIQSVGFMNELIKELKDYNRLRRIQSYTWPSIVRGLSMLIINSEKSGKTMSYLPIICNLVANEYSKGVISDKYGPIACIIVPSSVEVEQISKLANKFLRRCEEKIPVVGMFGVRDEKECMIQLLQLCGIFIGTPSCYRKLLKSEIAFFDPKRIKIAVIDEIDINSEFENEILRKLLPIKKNPDIQLVIVSRKWQKCFIKYLNTFENMVLCIGHYLEAAVYAKTHLRIELRENHEKIQSVLKYVHKYYYEYSKFIVVCNDDEEITDLMEALNKSAFSSLIINSRASSEDLKVVKDWMTTEDKDSPILICSDTELRQLNISNAEILIHYSLPSSWSKFCFRFSTQLGFYEDLVKINFDVKSLTRKPARSLILLDEDNSTQLPKLIKFMDNHGYSNRIAPEVIEVAKQTKIQTEMTRSKEMRIFCDKAMEFGDCSSDQCKKRHLFTKLDIAYKGIPTHGLIKIEILNVSSVTHYFARLLEFNLDPTNISDPSSWKYLRCSNEFSKVSVRLSLFYSNQENLNNEWPLETNKMCTYMDNETFHRCFILEHPPGLNECVMKSVKCVIKLIDTGDIRVVKSVDILKIPKEFEVFPPQAVEIRLNGIVPHHGERIWDKKANHSVKKWLTQEVNPQTDFICAKVNFALMDTIWVDNIVVKENVKGFECVNKINVRMSILKKNIGTKSEEAEIKLKKMAEDCGIKLDDDFQIEDLSWCSKEKTKVVPEEYETFESEDDFFESASETSFRNGGSDYEDFSQMPHISKTQIKLVSNDKPIKTKPEKPKQVIQKWDSLEEESYYKVNICAFKSPSEFFVCRMDSTDIINKVQEMESFIHKFLETTKTPISDFEVGQYCLAVFDGAFIRAKIQDLEVGSENTILNVFSCDFGFSSKCYAKDVYETSNEIISFMPYQAIQCKLIGIKPKKLTWEESVSNEIYDKMIDTIDSSSYWQVYAVKTSSKNNLGINAYEVLLFTDEGQVNNEIVKQEYALPDKDTNHFLELGNLMDGDEDIEFDLEMGMEDMTQSLGIPKEILEKAVSDAKENKLKAIQDQEEPKITEIPSENKIVEVKEVSKTVKKEKVLAEKFYKTVSLPTAPEKYRLKTVPSPKTTWYQTRHSISLTIAAPDLDDYELKVTDSMVIFAYMFDGELKLLELHLLATIKSEKTTTKIRGVNFHMTLLKAVPLMWPRLTFSSDKFPWLKYHYDKFEDNFEGGSKKKQIQEIEKAVNDDNIEEDDEGNEDVYYRRENQGNFKKVNNDKDERINDDYDRHLNDEFDPLDDGF